MAIAGLADGLRRWLREVVGLKIQLAIGELGDCGLAVVPPWGSQPHGRPTRSEPGSSVSPVERDADLEVAERIDARCPRTARGRVPVTLAAERAPGTAKVR